MPSNDLQKTFQNLFKSSLKGLQQGFKRPCKRPFKKTFETFYRALKGRTHILLAKSSQCSPFTLLLEVLSLPSLCHFFSYDKRDTGCLRQPSQGCPCIVLQAPSSLPLLCYFYCWSTQACEAKHILRAKSFLMPDESCDAISWRFILQLSESPAPQIPHQTESQVCSVSWRQGMT